MARGDTSHGAPAVVCVPTNHLTRISSSRGLCPFQPWFVSHKPHNLNIIAVGFNTNNNDIQSQTNKNDYKAFNFPFLNNEYAVW